MNKMKPYKIYYKIMNNDYEIINETISSMTQWYEIGEQPKSGDVLFSDSKFSAYVLKCERIYTKQEIREMKIKKLINFKKL